MRLLNVLTCPICQHKETLTMPTEACVYFYTCPKCHTLIRPKKEDCCVFCSYGQFPCPPKQTQNPS
ncbi:MAG: GDCCVxC domain-containing (seleno)protein [Bacteroidia bacterium]